MSRPKDPWHRNPSYHKALADISEDPTMTSAEILPAPEPIDADDFDKLKAAEKMGVVLSKLNLICAKVAEIDITINNNTDGLCTNIDTMSTQADEQSVEIANLKRENKVLQGLVQKQHTPINHLNDKVAMLSAKNMEKNITITGLLGDKKNEKCKDTVLTFLKNVLEIDAAEEEILVAHRIKRGQQTTDNRMMFV